MLNKQKVSPPSWYEPEISPEAIKAIILEEMKANKVKVEDIPTEPHISPSDLHLKDSERYYDKEVFALFACPEEDNYWKSEHAWGVVDLKEQTICYRYIQECRKCNPRSKAYPEFPPKSITKLAKFAVKWFLILKGRLKYEPPSTDADTDEVVGGGPHEEEMCERCKRLGHSCWKKD